MRISRRNQDDAHQALLIRGGRPVKRKHRVSWLSSRLADEWKVWLERIEQPLPGRTPAYSPDRLREVLSQLIGGKDIVRVLCRSTAFEQRQTDAHRRHAGDACFRIFQVI